MVALRSARLAGLALALLFFAAPPALRTAESAPAAAVTDRAPAAAVEALHGALAEAMTKSAALGCEGRTKLLAPVVEQVFDLPFIAERALRRHWKKLAPEQQQRFLAALKQSFIGTYATEFATPNAVGFVTGTTDTLPGGDAVVHTTLVPKGEAGIALDYIIKARAGGWQVVNVLADGVSDLALRSTQYDALMKSQGFEALMAKLQDQTLKLRSRCK